MISLDDYFQGLQQTHRKELTDEVKRNAPETVRRANILLSAFYADNPGAITRLVSSGWRPPSKNAVTPGAAKNSAHMTGQAIDLTDPDEELDDWLMSPNGEKVLRELKMRHERPEYTPRWAHIDTRIGTLHFIPR